MNFNKWVEDEVEYALYGSGRNQDIAFQVQSILVPGHSDQSEPERVNGQAYLMSTVTIGVYVLIWKMLPFEGEEHIPCMTYPVMPGLHHTYDDIRTMVREAIEAIDAQIEARREVQAHAAAQGRKAVVENDAWVQS